MDERTKQYHVGVMFLATLIATGILLVMFGKLPKYVGSYRVEVRFNNAGGIVNGTPIRKSGILIGRVADVQLADNDQHAMAILDIQQGKTIYQDEACYITRDLLGDTAVVFRRMTDTKKPHAPVALDVPLQGEISDDPTGLKTALAGPIKQVADTSQALTAASQKFGDAADRVCKILDSDAQRDVQNILRDAAASLKSVQKILGNEENQTKLTEAMSKLPNTFDSMNRTFASTDEALKKFTEPSGPDKKTPIERMVNTIELAQRALKDFNESPSPGVPSPAVQMKKVVSNVEEFTTILQNIAGRIERGDGTLGAMLHDRELYDRLNRTARNMEQVTRDLRPIIDDARRVSDKMARNPGSIIRGAVHPGSGVKE
jgi:phospholipid/cholesterol/gamma-HCH transport system substrate-binding protein